MEIQVLMSTQDGREKLAALALEGQRLKLGVEIGNFLLACEAVEHALKENLSWLREKPRDDLMIRLSTDSVTFAWESAQRAYDALVKAVEPSKEPAQ